MFIQMKLRCERSRALVVLAPCLTHFNYKWVPVKRAPVGARIVELTTGHMNKMAAMPIYGQNLKISSSKPGVQFSWNLG